MTAIKSFSILDIARDGPSIGTLTVKLSGMKRFKLQNALGVMLIKAGIAVLPVNIDVEYEESQ
jgi:hypothetical protein